MSLQLTSHVICLLSSGGKLFISHSLHMCVWVTELQQQHKIIFFPQLKIVHTMRINYHRYYNFLLCSWVSTSSCCCCCYCSRHKLNLCIVSTAAFFAMSSTMMTVCVWVRVSVSSWKNICGLQLLFSFIFFHFHHPEVHMKICGKYFW